METRFTADKLEASQGAFLLVILGFLGNPG